MTGQRGISLWRGQIGDAALVGIKYVSDSGYGIFSAKGARDEYYVGLIDQSNEIGHLTLSAAQREALKQVFAGAEPMPPEASEFRERRAAGVMAGVSVSLGKSQNEEIRIYKSSLFTDQILIALAKNGTEFCAIAINDSELPSLEEILFSQ